ncbi:YlxR family protein [Italian clover phyllody phytoplasma]|uniref:YlxR family protein n=1 Tax=Italian clover phyllody phytoplasma TaxID=1196420 RepID=UPI0002F9BE52|nr:YlxR family protein [Italian clover phyllody phytoplasma]
MVKKVFLPKNILRTCIVSRQKKPKKELIRVAISNQGVISLDLEQKLPGRGAYFILNNENLLLIQQKKLLDKKLKSFVDEKIYKQLWDLLN